MAPLVDLPVKFMNTRDRRSIPFIKMHGIGNDYVYIDCIQNRYEDVDFSDLARKIAHRHYGIGGDGLVLILCDENGDFRMRMFNSDGTEAEMCGNAVRCVGGYLHNQEYTSQTQFPIQTLAGPIGIEILSKSQIRVNMGSPELNPKKIPVNCSETPVIDHPLSIDRFSGHFTAVSMGNPHAVFFTEHVDDLDLPKIGPLIENHALFPNRVNTEFVEIISRSEVKFRVWERGAGETWACGTGAAAVLIAGVLSDRLDHKVVMHLKGGDLILETSENLTPVWKTGPFAVVGSGIYYYHCEK